MAKLANFAILNLDPPRDQTENRLEITWVSQVSPFVSKYYTYDNICFTGINWKIVSTYEPKIMLANSPA
eukprot:2662415-Pyramimonas_sp.AAC.1